jgi:hypothetical protein
VEVLLALQPHGPYLLLGVGPFSCSLATAMACELEQQGVQQVLLLLMDGPAAPPTSVQLAEPLAYGLHGLVMDALAAARADLALQQRLALGLPAWQRSQREQQLGQQRAELEALQASAPHVGEVAALVEAARQQAGAAAEPDQLVRALVQQLQQYCPPQDVGSGGSWVVQLPGVVSYCQVVARWLQGFTPEYVYQGPAAMLLGEDDLGGVFLDTGRDSCGGALSMLVLQGLASGEALMPRGLAPAGVGSMLVDALMELLKMV